MIDFYSKNEIEIKNNLFPLDLYTLLLISKNENEINSLDDLSKIFNSFKYSLGLSFLNKKDLKYLLIDKKNKLFDFKKINNEYRLKLFSDIYKNMNNNIIYASYDEVYQSFINGENLYTLFRDGVLLNKDLNPKFFQLFPEESYMWNEKKGIFEKNSEITSYSIFGFSAYLNNMDNIGFLCYLVQSDTRNMGFKNFNIQISPLSINDINLNNFEISKSYEKILLDKNKKIINQDPIEFKSFNIVEELIKGSYNFNDIVNTDNYLN